MAELGKKMIVLAGALLVAVTVGSFVYQGPGFGTGTGVKRSSSTTAGPGCSAGPYQFADLRLGSAWLNATLTNSGNVSVTPSTFTVTLGGSPNNTASLAASSGGFFQQSIAAKQSASLQFELRQKWILAPGSYDVWIAALSDSGILYSCNAVLKSSGESQVEIANASLKRGPGGNVTLSFVITNHSDGIFTGGALCYVGQSDCPGGSSARFDPVPAHGSAPEQASFNLSGIDPRGAVLFSLVLDVGVVYLFPVSTA